MQRLLFISLVGFGLAGLAAPAQGQEAEGKLPPVLHARNARVHTWLDTVAVRNRKIKFAKGYRVQVYVGQDRAKAMEAKEALYRLLTGTEVYMTYTAPSFRLVCGDYLSRIEAQLAARALAQHFAAPLIVPAQVRLR